MKLSKRLRQIDNMITQHYDHIWDCCCDHGQLGKSLLQRQAANTIHFVDIVEPLMTNLKIELEDEFAEQTPNSIFQENWQVHCISAADISIKKAIDTTARNLLIISGVGGDLLIDLVHAILRMHPNQELEFILCPVYHNYKVRQALTDMGLGLINENLVKEKKHFYEIIHVSTQANTAISKTGSIMWNFSRIEDKEYLKQCIAHYQRTSKNKPSSNALLDYQKLNIRLPKQPHSSL